MYLGETFGVHEGDAELYPAPGPPRGEAMKWIVWANTTLAAAGGRLAASLPVGAPGGVEAGSRDVVTSVGKEDLRREEEKARIEVEEALKILEVGLMGKDFLLGKRYCLADTHVWSFVSWLTVMGVSTASFSGTRSWMTRVGDRPTLKDLQD